MHLLQYSPVTQNENWKRGGKGSFLLAKNNILIKKKKEYRQVRPEDDLWLFRPIIFLTKENIKLLHLFRHRYPKKSGGKTMNLFPILVMVMIKMVELLQEILEISITLSIRSLAQKSWRLVKASWFAARYPAETGYISWREHASSGSVGVSNSNATDQIPPSGRIAGSWRQTHGGSVHIFIDASWRENKARLAGVAIRGGGVCINSWFKCMDAASPSTGGEAHALLLASGSTARNPGWSGTFIFAFWREGCCTICCQGCTKTTTGDK